MTLPQVTEVIRNGDFQTIKFSDGSEVYTPSEQDENGEWRDGRGIDTVLNLAKAAEENGAFGFMIAREKGIAAADELLQGTQQNVLGQALMWRVVNAALDAYEDEWASWLFADPTVGFVVSLNGQPLEVTPTKRMARAVRRLLANRDRRKRSDYRISTVVVYRS